MNKINHIGYNLDNNIRGGSVEVKNCCTCKKDRKIAINIFQVHICKKCLNSIENLQVGQGNYDYYKNIISNAYRNYFKLKVN